MGSALFTVVPKGYFGLLRFVTPYYPPLGIGYLAAVVEKLGWHVAICDRTHTSERRLLATVARSRPDLIGVSAVVPLLEPALSLARKLRQASPGSLLVIGGPLVSCWADDLVRDGGYDAAVLGEAEHVIGAIAAIAAGGPDARAALASVPGVVTRRGEHVVRCPATPPTTDLDSLSYPARHLFAPKSLYLSHPGLPRHVKGTAILTSRGCPYRCSFCYRYPYKERYRTHSPGYVVDELIHLRETYAIEYVRFQDDTLTFDRHRILRLCDEMAARVPGLAWDCTTRIDLVDPEMLRAMARAGCRSITFGLESGEPDDLDRMRKEVATDVRAAVQACVDAGIKPSGHFILGFPWDTPETIRARVGFARSLPLALTLFWPFQPWPNTPIHDQLQAEGPEARSRHMSPGAAARAALRANLATNLRPSRVGAVLAARFRRGA